MSTKKLGTFSDHPRKILFRNNWARPLLEWINLYLNTKLIYLGLPGTKALDIISWIKYLEKIIAFEFNENKNDIQNIYNILNDFEKKSMISSFSFFEGYLEKIIMQEVDDNGEIFSLKDFITVYNLDFCNTLTTPCEVETIKGDVLKFYKLDAINKLVSYQDKNLKDVNKFIMFLTVNSIFWEDEYKRVSFDYSKEFDKKIKHLNLTGKSLRQLKAFVFCKINEIAKKNNFIVELLPPIYYRGIGRYKNKKGKMCDHWLNTYTIIGSRYDEKNEKIVKFKQDIQNFLDCKFIFANDRSFSNYTDKSINEINIECDPITLMKDSYFVNQIWK